MPVDVTEKYIRIRKHSPGKYVRLRTKVLSASQGIKAIIGFKKDGGSEVQSYLFKKEQWTVSRAKIWVKEHKANEKILSGEKNGKIVLPMEIGELKFKEDEYRTEIQVLPVGLWKHPVYGKIKISARDVEEFISNFNDRIRKDIAITEGHSVGEKELPAVGWFKELVSKGREGLWGVIEWTKKGKQLLQEKAYKYFSPEFYSTYEDPESQKVYSNVLVGGALTNRPYFKGLVAVVLSEYTFSESMSEELKLEDILEKDVGELNEEEKTFLKEKKDDLTDEQKETYKDVIGEGAVEKTELEKLLEKDVGDLTEDEKATIKENEGELSEEQKESHKDILEEEGGGEGGEGKEKEKKGSEKFIKVSVGAMKVMERNAKEGVKAMAILRKENAENFVNGKVFSESCKKGPFLPKSRSKVVAFYLSLTGKQQGNLKDILEEIPGAEMFSELGKGAGLDIKASEQIEKLVQAALKEDSELGYRPALEKVLADNPELAKQVERE